MKYTEEDIKVITTAASKLITSKPCWLFSVNWGLTANAENHFKLYNGRDTAGELYFDVNAGKFFTFPLIGFVPVYFSQGLYCEFVANGFLTTFQILEEF